MTARTYIKNNIEQPYRKKLLDGLDIYLRRIKNVSFHTYNVEDLAAELYHLQKRRGIGKVSMNALRHQLQADGYLQPPHRGHTTLLRTLWGRVKSAFKASL